MRKRNEKKKTAQISDSPHKKEIGDRIAEAIGEETVKGFSRRCGIPESSLRDYITNKKRPGIEAVNNIASASGVTVDWLANGRGIKSAEELRRLAHAQQDNASQDERDDFARRYGRRLEKVEILLRMMPEADRERSINEFLSRVQELKEAHDLRTAVAELRAALQKSA